MDRYLSNLPQKQLALGRQIGCKILILASSKEIQERLSALELLSSLPSLPSNGRELKEYDETRKLYKQIFTTCASTIVQILHSDHACGRHDPEKSFNYSVPPEPLDAAEKIQLLPQAYMSEPIKAALRSPYRQVRFAATQCYHRLPDDIQYCGLFSESDRKQIRREMQSL